MESKENKDLTDNEIIEYEYEENDENNSEEKEKKLPKCFQNIIDTDLRIGKMRYLTKYENHKLIIFDPNRKMKEGSGKNTKTITRPVKKSAIDPSAPYVKLKSSPVRFVTQKNTETNKEESIIRNKLLQKFKEEDMFCKSWDGRTLVPCMAHGDFVDVRSLEADHATAKSTIRDRQTDLIKKINENKNLQGIIENNKALESFFRKGKFPGDTEDKYYGTLFFYELYFNDIDNIWLICDCCNGTKTNEETLEWLGNKCSYGQRFIEYLNRLDRNDEIDKKILEKLENQNGLAEVLIKWYWKNEAHSIFFSKDVLENIETPLKILNESIEKIEDIQERKYSQASLDFIISIAKEIIKIEGIVPATEEQIEEFDNTGRHDPNLLTDKKGDLVETTVSQYEAAGKEVQNNINTFIMDAMINTIESNRNAKRSKDTSKETDEKDSNTNNNNNNNEHITKKTKNSL